MDETPAVDEAPEVTKDASCVKTTTAESPATKRPKRVSSQIDLYNKRSTIVHHNSETYATRNHRFRLSNKEEKLAKLLNNSMFSFIKDEELPWYRLMMATTPSRCSLNDLPLFLLRAWPGWAPCLPSVYGPENKIPGRV